MSDNILYAVSLDLGGNELRNVVLQPLATAPNNPAAGRMYFDTTVSVGRIYSGTSWVSFGGGGGGGTTYTFSEGDTNGAFVVTPEGGSPQTVYIHGLEAAAYKAVDSTITSGTSSTNVPTSAAVDAAISEAVSAIDAMHYKGTVGSGGTVSDLPTSGVAVGDTYKVATAGTYAGQVAKVGDMFIATATTPTWSYIPSGDDGNANTYTAASPALTASGGLCTWTVTHGLGKQFVNVDFALVSTGEIVLVNLAYISTSQLTVSVVSASDIAEGTYRIVCTG